MLRIGLFGGLFDPVHLGHLLVAQAAWEELALTRLFFIPAAQSPFKPEPRPALAEERLRLLRLALAGKSWCAIDPQELGRGAVSYTIDTIRDYTRRFPQSQLLYLIGQDNLPQLPKWREASELARLAEFVVYPRPVLPEIAAAQENSASHAGAPASCEVVPGPAGGLPALPKPFRGRFLAGFPVGISSRQIRARVKAGRSIEPLVPGTVAEAIRNNGLYL
ncbi:putative nicotinate-nucleotide adenylyltransferase [Verrucomicrobia bacterium]|nr:putative nicotinate-nucleotide adenylyltransferase [Verrucomicrobiota bacterium]